MIKRRFYKLEHGDRDSGSDSSSFSSGSESELEVEVSEESDEDSVVEPETEEYCPTSSGYESEESSGNVLNGDAAVVTNDSDHDEDDGDACSEDDRRTIPVKDQLFCKNVSKRAAAKPNVRDGLESELEVADFILKCKSVYKCRICPKVVCLNVETMGAHVKSKRHARSKKLLKNGRLKAILDSNGQIEELETVEEEQAPEEDKPKKKKMSQRKRKNLKRMKKKSIDEGESKAAKPSPSKKRQKTDK